MNDRARPLVDVGDLIAGRYRVDRVLGKGAMGIVVAATHIELRKLRAIKFMLPEKMSDAQGVERFLREARAASELKSQHAVKIHDVARLPTGEPYIVMEYLEGEDLKSVADKRRILPVPEAVMYMLQACEAIAEAHAAGIVHRDLKPANMFLSAGVGGAPCVKVLDFGIAKVNDAETLSSDVHLTSTYTILGSPLYMSPEQIVSTRSVDARSDIWALGVILYGLVSGGLPFRASNPHVLFASVHGDEPIRPSHWKPDLPPELERILLRCLEKDPARRFQSVGELAAALAPFAPEGARRSYPGASASGPFPPPSASSGSFPPSASPGSYPQPPPSGTIALQSSPSGSFPHASASGPYPQSSPSGSFTPQASTQMMNTYPSGATSGLSQSDMSAQNAQTNAPLAQSIQSIITTPHNRSRELLLAGGGFGAALLLVGLVFVMSRSSGAPETAPAAAQPPTERTATAPVSPQISEPASPAPSSTAAADAPAPGDSSAATPAGSPAVKASSGGSSEPLNAPKPKTLPGPSPAATPKPTAPAPSAPSKGPPARSRNG